MRDLILDDKNHHSLEYQSLEVLIKIQQHSLSFCDTYQVFYTGLLTLKFLSDVNPPATIQI